MIHLLFTRFFLFIFFQHHGHKLFLMKTEIQVVMQKTGMQTFFSLILKCCTRAKIQVVIISNVMLKSFKWQMLKQLKVLNKMDSLFNSFNQTRQQIEPPALWQQMFSPDRMTQNLKYANNQKQLQVKCLLEHCNSHQLHMCSFIQDP